MKISFRRQFNDESGVEQFLFENMFYKFDSFWNFEETPSTGEGAQKLASQVRAVTFL